MLLPLHPRFRPFTDAALFPPTLRPPAALLADFVAARTETPPTGPALNVRDLGDAYVLEAELPGQRLEDVEIEIHDKTLTISGKRSACPTSTPENEAGKMLLREHWSGAFSRTLHFPEAMDSEQVTSEFQAGLLRLRLPKKNRATPRKIRLADIPHGNLAA